MIMLPVPTPNTCTDCDGPADEFNSVTCDGCSKPVCDDCVNKCMGGSFVGCRGCHGRMCHTAECWED